MSKRLWAIRGNDQKLDGGAMFGNAPRALWTRWSAPDDHNRIDLACRCLLLREESGRTVLFETGIGAFFPPKMRERFGVQQAEHVLLDELEKAGFPHDVIDVVVLSHLHFDHAGGLLKAYREGEESRLLFPKAKFVVGAEAFARAQQPHPRDRASFIPQLPELLKATGRLEVVEGERSETLGEDYRLHRSSGHTPGMILSEIASDEGPIVFAADLIPGRPWVHVPITMGYDRYPEQLIDEKTELLEDLVQRNGRLFFTHDAECAMARVVKDERGRFKAGQRWDEPRGLAL